MFKLKNIFFVSVVAIVLTGFTGGEVVISGKVFSNKPEIARCIMLVKVVARKSNRVLAVGHDLLDTTGVYKLDIHSSVPSQQAPVDIFIAGLGLDTMYV